MRARLAAVVTELAALDYALTDCDRAGQPPVPCSTEVFRSRTGQRSDLQNIAF
jgi:hypothetical protein